MTNQRNETPEPLAGATVECCISALVSALQQDKGWLHDYADSVVRDAIDRKHLEPLALPAHPEPHSHTWTEQEKGCILAWGTELVTRKAEPLAQEQAGEMPVVAWRDDGLSASNGTDGPSHRVVTDKTKQNMPNTAVAAYTDPLVRLSDATAALQAKDAEIAEWRKLSDPAVLHANLLRGLPAQLTREQLLHLLGDDAEIERLKAALDDASMLLKRTPRVCMDMYDHGARTSFGFQAKAMVRAIDAMKGES